jgi:hypothetical protein
MADIHVMFRICIEVGKRSCVDGGVLHVIRAVAQISLTGSFPA